MSVTAGIADSSVSTSITARIESVIGSLSPWRANATTHTST